MQSSKKYSYSSLQNQLQTSEKKFQTRAYELSLEVQENNKLYQKTLSEVDKAYDKAEQEHADKLKDLANKYAEENKKLTQKNLEEKNKKEASLKQAKERWEKQQKTIQDGFDDTLGVKKAELQSIEKDKAAQQKAIEDEYQKAKAQIQSTKTETTEIFLKAQEPFTKSLKYYMNRLSNGAKDDQKYLKQELSNLRKDLTELEQKEASIIKELGRDSQAERRTIEALIKDYVKVLNGIAAKIKTAFTAQTTRFDSTIEGFNDIIKSGVQRVRSVENKIDTAIETMDAKEKAFLDDPQVSIDTPVLKTITKELSETNDMRHAAFQEVYQSLFHYIDDLTEYVRSIRDDAKKTVHKLMDDHLKVYTELIEEATLIADTHGYFETPEDAVRHMRVGQFKSTILSHFETTMQPFMTMQKKWHAKLLKMYKELSGVYEELDEIQAFYDSFDDEKALAFENEQVHISKKSSQLNIEMEASKKQYEVDMLEADQRILFEQKKRDYLEKVAAAEKRLALTRIKAELNQQKKASQATVDEAKADFLLKKAYANTEKSLLKDKQKYVVSREKEAFELQRLENEKAKDNALYAMDLHHKNELDVHDMSISQAENDVAKAEESKRQKELNFGQAHLAEKQEKILELKKERDGYTLELKRIEANEDQEMRDIESVKNDETAVPENRLKEFDRALNRRQEAINKPYKTLLKTFDTLSGMLDDPELTHEKVVNIVSMAFKNKIVSTLENHYETLRWTREYYSELETSRIKRARFNTRKQTTETRRHEQLEAKYLESLETYLKSARQNVEAFFEKFDQKIDKPSPLKQNELVRATQQFHNKTLEFVQSQTQSVMTEVQSLFDYIRAQDTDFIQEMEEGYFSAIESIEAKYRTQRTEINEKIDQVNAKIKLTQQISKSDFTPEEMAVLDQLDGEINTQLEQVQALEQARLQKIERFQKDRESLEDDYQRIADNITFEETRKLNDIDAEFSQEAERIKAKIEQAKHVFEAIKQTEQEQLSYYKQVNDYKIANEERAYNNKIRLLDDAVEETKRQQARRKVEIERGLNRRIDAIQKEISSKETLISAAIEKVNREYDTLYFDKQTRAQKLNEQIEIVRKQLIDSKQGLLDEIAEALGGLPPLSVALGFESLITREKEQLTAHHDEISAWIDAKKRAFQESL